MDGPSRTPSLESKLLVLTGLSLWLLTGAAGIWEVLAMQAPDSPFHLGILPGPIAQLRAYSFGLGTGLLLGAWLWPQLYAEGQGRILLGMLVFGSLVQVSALLSAASHGMLAVQVFDPRPDARFLLYARALGHALTLLAGAGILSRALKRFRPPRA
jgi:hypothetical protein